MYRDRPVKYELEGEPEADRPIKRVPLPSGKSYSWRWGLPRTPGCRVQQSPHTTGVFPYFEHPQDGAELKYAPDQIYSIQCISYEKLDRENLRRSKLKAL